MKLTLLFAMCAALLLGCASVTSEQSRLEPDGSETRTKFKAKTFWDSKNELVKARTTQTDKSQGLTLAGLEQESSGTNATALLERAIGAAVGAAVKSVAP